MKRGQITVTIGAAVTAGTILVSGLTSYFTDRIRGTVQLNEVKAELKEDISKDRQNISALQSDNESMKKWLERVEAKLDKAIAQ